MNEVKGQDWLRELEEQVAREKNVSVETLRRLLVKVEDDSEGHRASDLPDELLKILEEDLERQAQPKKLKEDA
jgi:DNA sulfur modification protein DndC